MKAAAVAKKLTDAGLTVKSLTEGDDDNDGEVQINDTIHVQVPTYGGGLRVVREDADGVFRFYPRRGVFSTLVDDVRDAIKNQQEAQS
jgi:hypothetical protein